MTPSGTSYNVTTTEVARYCTKGAKPAISFDEKYMVLHRYASDRSDIYLVDLNPVQGREQAGRRPVLVLSVNAFTRQLRGDGCAKPARRSDRACIF